MITSMHIENFKCFKDFHIDLGPLNVLIGPNDSGKTALLQAILVASAFGAAERILDPGAIAERVGVGLGVETPHGGISAAEPAITVRCGAIDNGRDVGSVTITSSRAAQEWMLRFEGTGPQQALGKVHLCQFDPACLRRPVELSHEFEPNGIGLAAFLARLSLNFAEARDSLQELFRRRFCFYTGIQTIPRKINGTDVLHLRFTTTQGQKLPAASVSDGLMVSLGFLALSHDPEPPSILLVEQPENHVHHASLKDIIATLKHLSGERGVQVILTTHSPYLLDCVAPEEVQVFYKDDEGAVHAGKLSDHPDIETLKKHFRTGEIWTGFESDKDIVQKTGGFE